MSVYSFHKSTVDLRLRLTEHGVALQILAKVPEFERGHVSPRRLPLAHIPKIGRDGKIYEVCCLGQMRSLNAAESTAKSHDFLIAFLCNYVYIFYRFRDT